MAEQKMSISGITQLIGLLLDVTSKLLDKFPDYDQQKREKFYDLQKKFHNEIVKEYYDRDDDYIMDLRWQIQTFVQIFLKELK